MAGLDKNASPSSLGEEEIKNVFKALKEVINNKTRPLIVYQNKEAFDVVPFELKIYKDLDKKEFKTYDEALDYYFLNEFKEVKQKTKQEKEIERLKRIITAQEETIKELEDKEAGEREKADLIYQNYELINNILAELKNATKKYDWKEIEKRIKGHKLIKSVNAKDKTIEIEIED